MDRSYNVRVIREDETNSVIGFLRRFFFRDEPLNVETGMDLDYKNGINCPELEAYCTNSIPEGNSVLAVSDSNEIVGVCLSAGMTRHGPKEVDECPNDKFKKVLDLLVASEEQCDIFAKYPNLNKLLDIKIVSVDTNWRGMGICKALLEKTREVAQEQDFQLLKAVCTSYISAVAVEKLGYEKVHVLKYSDHLEDGTNVPVFNPPPPHSAVQIYVYKLDDNLLLKK